MRVAMTACAMASLIFGLPACEAPSRPDGHRRPTASQERISREPLEPLPDPPPLDPRLVALGKRLFSEARLSSDDSVSCSSCHDLADGGADGRRLSVGAKGRNGMVNAPTVYNAGLNFLQFWDGRAATLEEQIDSAVESPLDLDTSWDQIVAKLVSDPQYRSSFEAIFRDGVTASNVKSALAAFERTLITTDSPFDRWLKGDSAAMTGEQKAGYETFKAVGCVACHQGRNVGGNMLQRFGVFGDYFADRGDVTTADYGRFNVTHDEADRFVFRVPSLRSAARTAPYFHDGAAPALSRAVQVMARYQLGRRLTDEQVASIVAFIDALAPRGEAGGE